LIECTAQSEITATLASTAPEAAESARLVVDSDVLTLGDLKLAELAKVVLQVYVNGWIFQLACLTRFMIVVCYLHV